MLIENPIDSVMQTIAATVQQWKLANPPDAIQAKTVKLLDTHADEIVMKLLGFNKDSWNGNWALDHCNGRSGNSAAGDWLLSKQAGVVAEWLTTCKMPTLSKSAIASMNRECQSMYEQALRAAVADLIRTKATKDAAALFDQLTSPDALNQFLKVQALINPPD